MKKGKYYYLANEPDETKNPSGVISFKESLGLFWGYDGKIIPNVLDTDQFLLKGGEFCDYLIGNLTLRIFSGRLKSLVDSFLTDIDNPVWHRIKVVKEFSEESRDYFILQFHKQPTILNTEKTIYLDSKKKRIIKPYFDEKLISDRHIFTYKEYANPTIVSFDLKSAIQQANYTGIYFYDILSSGKLI